MMRYLLNPEPVEWFTLPMTDPPVELTWPCPRGLRWARLGSACHEGCSTCGGEGTVRFGELAAGDAAHEVDDEGGHAIVPASLSEIITVQAYRVHGDPDTHDATTPYVDVDREGTVRFYDGNVGTPITAEFPVPPEPGEWVGRVIERRALTEPTTEYPCYCGTGITMHGPSVADVGVCSTCNGERTARLPQGVGLYEADPALAAEIERRLP